MPSAPGDHPARPAACCAAPPAGPTPGPPTGAGARARSDASYRHHPVFLPGTVHLLGGRHLESPDQHRPRLSWIDDVVDEGTARGDVGVDEPPEFLDPPGALRVGIGGGGDLLAEDDIGA